MSQTSSAHFIMQMQLSGAAQISPPFEIGCCLPRLCFPPFLALGFERKGFVIVGRQLESGGEAGGWRVGGRLPLSDFLSVPFPLFWGKAVGKQ